MTKYISEINFVSSADQGDLIEMGLTATRFGRTSLTMRAEVRNMFTRQTILTIEKIVFVNLGEAGKPEPHGYTEITYYRDRFPASIWTPSAAPPSKDGGSRVARSSKPQAAWLRRPPADAVAYRHRLHDELAVLVHAEIPGMRLVGIQENFALAAAAAHP